MPCRASCGPASPASPWPSSANATARTPISASSPRPTTISPPPSGAEEPPAMPRQDAEAATTALAERLHRTARSALRQHRPREALPSLDRLRHLPGQAGIAEALRAEALLALHQPEDADAAAAAALRDAPD